MAAPRKKRADHLTDGTWRADRHADRVDARGVPGIEHDSVLWNQLRQWQERFDEAADDVTRNGSTMDSKGQVVQNPACKVMKDASAEIRELCKVLGIGPLNRSRLGHEPARDEGDDDGIPAPKVRHARQ